MTNAWPSDVPQKALAGTENEEPQDNLRRFQPAVGAELLGRRASLSIDIVNFQTQMTEAQYDSLISFWRNTLLDGSLTFVRKHPRALAGRDLTMQFTDKPKFASRGPKFGVVTLAMVVLP